LQSDDFPSVQILEHILSLGAKVDIANEAGLTPLHMVAETGRPYVLTEFLNAKDININVQDCCGDTALHKVLSCTVREVEENIGMFDELLKAGADCSIQNSAGL
jgi:ankyrin repeat protein